MSPLNKRIAYKKRGGLPVLKYFLLIVIFVVAFYLLFYHKFENRTIYERVAGFFKSEIEKTPSVTIKEADKGVKSLSKREIPDDNPPTKKESPKNGGEEKDEIEEVIKKRLKEK
ncbi:MAG: hypothetical protein ACP5KG_11060 [Myxococcota bacterium]